MLKKLDLDNWLSAQMRGKRDKSLTLPWREAHEGLIEVDTSEEPSKKIHLVFKRQEVHSVKKGTSK